MISEYLGQSLARLNETRTFSVEYRVVPGQVQFINVTPGWNAVSLYLKPKDSSLSKYLEDKPYRGVFVPSGEDWTFNMKDSSAKEPQQHRAGQGLSYRQLWQLHHRGPRKVGGVPLSSGSQQGLEHDRGSFSMGASA